MIACWKFRRKFLRFQAQIGCANCCLIHPRLSAPRLDKWIARFGRKSAHLAAQISKHSRPVDAFSELWVYIGHLLPYPDRPSPRLDAGKKKCGDDGKELAPPQALEYCGSGVARCNGRGRVTEFGPDYLPCYLINCRSRSPIAIRNRAGMPYVWRRRSRYCSVPVYHGCGQTGQRVSVWI